MFNIEKKSDLIPTQQRVDLLSDMFGRYAREFFSPYLDSEEKGFKPRVEIKETQKGYHVSVELPGMAEEDINVSLKDNCLILEGTKENSFKDDQEGYFRSEFIYGSFYRTIPLETDVDDKNVEANYDKGVLTIELIKKADGIEKTRKIAINKNKKH